MFNMPANLNRRRLLLGLASASAASAAIVATGAHAAKSDEPTESATLLKLAEQLAGAKAEMVAANDAYDKMMHHWWSKWPIAPDAIVKPYRDDRDNERGLDGSMIGPDGRRNHATSRPLFSADYIRWEIAGTDRRMKRRRPKHPLSVQQLMELEAERAMLSDKLALAQKYESEKARVLEASGYAAIKARREAAREALLSVVSRIMAEPETTMAGVIIKAEALTAWASAPYYAIEVKGWAWPQQLAASLLRIAGEAQPEQA